MIRLAFIGYGHVARALDPLLRRQQERFPFRITGIHTGRHGTVVNPRGVSPQPVFGPAAANIGEFLDAAHADVAVELTTLNPATGEPAISHIHAAFDRGMHVVTANKGPVAHAYADLRDRAARSGVMFRFESAVMDGAPVFNLVRSTLPCAQVLGFTGVLNSTSNLVIEAMENGGSFEDGLALARGMGVAEADASFDVEGWDSAAKTAALANVLMDARTNPQAVNTRGITRLTPERMAALGRSGKTVRLISRGRRNAGGITLRVRAEVIHKNDPLAAMKGTSNLLLLHTDLMGTIGMLSVSPGVEQTAYGVWADLVEIAANVSGRTMVR